MKTIVVDACIAIKWFVPEIHAIPAARLLDMPLKFLVPDLIYAEVGNILWKKCRRKELDIKIASAILHDFKKLPLESYANEELLDGAWKIATKYHCTLYDSLYLSLAAAEECLLVTADQVLCNSLQKTPLAKSIVWVENI